MPTQIIRVTTAAGSTDYVADRVIVEGDDCVLLLGQVEVVRIPMADTISIETIYSHCGANANV
jgi:hypothetical protein